MRNSKPTVILTEAELVEIVGAFERHYIAATADPYNHGAYEANRAELRAVLLRTCGLRKGTAASVLVDEALFDNYGSGRAMVVAALTLTDHNVVINGTFIPAGTQHYSIHETLRTLNTEASI